MFSNQDESHKVFEDREFEGVKFTALSRPIKNGDTYLVEGEHGVKLLTAREVDRKNGWVVPEEQAYFYDIFECVPIRFDTQG